MNIPLPYGPAPPDSQIYFVQEAMIEKPAVVYIRGRGFCNVIMQENQEAKNKVSHRKKPSIAGETPKCRPQRDRTSIMEIASVQQLRLHARRIKKIEKNTKSTEAAESKLDEVIERLKQKKKKTPRRTGFYVNSDIRKDLQYSTRKYRRRR